MPSSRQVGVGWALRRFSLLVRMGIFTFLITGPELLEDTTERLVPTSAYSPLDIILRFQLDWSSVPTETSISLMRSTWSNSMVPLGLSWLPFCQREVADPPDLPCLPLARTAHSICPPDKPALCASQ